MSKDLGLTFQDCWKRSKEIGMDPVELATHGHHLDAMSRHLYVLRDWCGSHYPHTASCSAIHSVMWVMREVLSRICMMSCESFMQRALVNQEATTNRITGGGRIERGNMGKPR